MQNHRNLNPVTSLFSKSLLPFALGLAVCLGGASIWAQGAQGTQGSQGVPAAQEAQDVPPQQGATATLHVYANLVQIPVLVLDPWGAKLASPIAPNRFRISIDKGPWRQPSYARLEADDPLDLSIVLDTRTVPADMLEAMDQAVADLAPAFLRPHDHVSIYAIDCSTLAYVEDVPAESARLKRAMDTSLRAWTARRQKIKAPCIRENRLWDVLEFATRKLAIRPGRRALLAMTDGRDQKSKLILPDLTKKIENAGVTLFALDPVWSGRFRSGSREDALLSNACESTGGLLLNQENQSAASAMQRFTQILRERYIVEFPRPPELHAGGHVLDVKIDKLNAFIRVSGKTVPLGEGTQIAGASTAGPESLSTPETAAANAAAVTAESNQPAPVVAVAPPPATAVPQVPSVTAIAQPLPPGTDGPTLTLKVATKLTVEDVTVSDDKRRPVHGLLRSDFTVKEDGKPQSIRTFEEYGAGVPPPPASQPAASQLPANTFTNAQPAPPNTSAVNILLLDNITTGLGYRVGLGNVNFPKQQAINYLKRMPLGTQVAILKLENQLHLVQGVTTDRDVLLAAMNTITFKQVPGSSNSPPASLDDACDRANRQSRWVLDAMEQEAAYLSGIKGRKNLIWFTPGVPWLTNYPEFSRIPCLVDFTEQLHRAYGLLNAAQIALYPVDPRGLIADPLFLSAAPRPGGGPPPNAAPGSAAHGAADHDSLRAMASATGGVAFYDRNDLDGAVEEAIATGADYYSVAYTPPLSKYDGQYHTIEIKVDRPHLNLQYRPGYTSINLTKPSESADGNSAKAAPPPVSAFEAAMDHGAAPSTQLLFEVSVTPSTGPAKPGDPFVIGTLNPALKGKSLVRYDLVFTLSGDQIALVDGPDGNGIRKASVEFVVAAYDDAGKVLNYLGQSTRWTLQPNQVAQFTQQSHAVKMQIDLPSGKIFVRFGLLDPASQKVGTLEIPVAVAK
jgi:VWFA-related protein